MKVLLIWDSCGADPIQLYEVEGESAELTIKCEGQYVNADDLSDDASIHQLNELLCGPNGEVNNDFALIIGEGFRGPYDAIVVCGFIP